MTKLTFYHQVRADGGERTGIDSDESQLLHFFQPGRGEADPALLWYLDVRCEGDGLPDDGTVARDWFLTHQAFFVSQLTKVADEELSAGFDAEMRPFQREIVAPDGTRVLIVVSAVRRLVAREIAKNIRQVSQNWKSLMGQLVPLSVV